MTQVQDYIVQVNGMYGWGLEEIAFNEKDAYERLEKLQKQNPNEEYRVKLVVDGWWHDPGLVK